VAVTYNEGMSKTYSFPKPDTTNADRSWEQRWTKKFGTWQKPITVPAAMIQSPGIVDLPPVPAVDLSQWIPADYAALETRAVDSQLTGPRLDEKKAAELMIDWKSAMDKVTCDFAAGLRRAPGVPDSWEPPKFMSAMTGSFSGRRETKPPAPPEPRKLDREGTSIATGYLDAVYRPECFQVTVKRMVKAMRPYLDSFDAIAFRGSSGAALAYPLAFMLNKPLIHVRKEMGHSSTKVEGLMGAKRIAIVDDFVETGETLRTIMKDIVAAYAEKRYAAPVLTHLFFYACYSEVESIRDRLDGIGEGYEIHLAHDD
jgi:hypothetical protein